MTSDGRLISSDGRLISYDLYAANGHAVVDGARGRAARDGERRVADAIAAHVIEQEIHVWIVEDDASLRDAMCELCEQRPGMRCTLAVESCEEALAALLRRHVPHVVLMDLGLPGMSGVDGIAHTKTISPVTEVVVVTARADDDDVSAALCAGACGYLLKPVSGEQIVGAVEAACQGGAPMSPAIGRQVLRMLTRSARPKSDCGLTERERQLLQLLVGEQTQKQIAHALGLSPHTVDTHLRHIYAKLHVHSRSGAVARALQERLL